MAVAVASTILNDLLNRTDESNVAKSESCNKIENMYSTDYCKAKAYLVVLFYLYSFG